MFGTSSSGIFGERHHLDPENRPNLYRHRRCRDLAPRFLRHLPSDHPAVSFRGPAG
jgi:hypothetical protein